MLGNDGELTRNYGKKSSLNMKNYSTVSLGGNDDIRNVYERSASQRSKRSCETPRVGSQLGMNQT
jgi:hypothetical protein